MTLIELKQILSNRLVTLMAARRDAQSIGDLERVVTLDVSLNDTMHTIAQLNTLDPNATGPTV